MQNLKICSLYSGSKGNSVFIEAGGAKILIDAGRSAKALCASLQSIGVDIDEIDAIFITHEHNDHTSALQTLSHKHNIPMHLLLKSAQIYNGLFDEKLCLCLALHDKNDFEVQIKGLTVKAFPTPHDSHASVGYKLTFREGGEEISIAYATDTGHVSEPMLEHMLGARYAVIESNHDIDMLRDGPYPFDLKARIASPKGHLSNTDCAVLASRLAQNGAKAIMLAHLSEENNLPDLALCEIRGAVADDGVAIEVASQYEPTWLVNLEKTRADKWQPSDL